jgi:hypothetical protein
VSFYGKSTFSMLVHNLKGSKPNEACVGNCSLCMRRLLEDQRCLFSRKTGPGLNGKTEPAAAIPEPQCNTVPQSCREE